MRPTAMTRTLLVAALVVVAPSCGGQRKAPELAPADPEGGEPSVRCSSNDDCRADEECDDCGTSSCPTCEDCVAICVAR